MREYEHLDAVAPWMDCVAIQRDLVDAEEMLRRLAEMRTQARQETTTVAGETAIV